jgi:hypothetical protein
VSDGGTFRRRADEPKPGLQWGVKVFVKRTSMVGAALVSIWLVGCDAGARRPLVLPEGAPAELEPGFVALPPSSELRPPRANARCGKSEPQTSAPPAIEILSSGGIGGHGTGNVQIWEDGTVLFDGAGCPKDRGRRGTMSAARVRALVDALDAAGFFAMSCNDKSQCADAFITSLTVRRGRANHTLVAADCSDSVFAAQAIELVRKTVGTHGCMP